MAIDALSQTWDTPFAIIRCVTLQFIPVGPGVPRRGRGDLAPKIVQPVVLCCRCAAPSELTPAPGPLSVLRAPPDCLPWRHLNAAR